MLPALQGHFQAMEDRRHQLLNELERCTASQRVFQPAPDAWSLGGVAHHLMLVEQATLQVLNNRRRAEPMRRRLRHVVGSVLVRLVFALGIRVKVPFRGIEPRPDVPLPELKQQWEQVRREMAAYLDGITEDALYPPVLAHPIGGPMNIPQGLDFLVRHFDHHLRQVARIRRAPAFPR